MNEVLAVFDWSDLALDWSMRSLFIVCGLVGGGILIFQTVLLFLGVDGGDAGFDFDADADIGDGAFGIFSVRAISSFFAFFGLIGWGALEYGFGPIGATAAGVAVGLAAMLLIAWLLKVQMRLQSKGNLDPANAIGKSATVYLRVPGARRGQGKITVSIQGRTAEYPAVTSGAEIPTGAVVRVVSMPAPGTFDVVPLEATQPSQKA